MTTQNLKKKHVVVSFRNLSTALQDAVKQSYPRGFTDAMMRVEKPGRDFFYAVPFETEEVSYLVKIDVKIDDGSHEEEDKEFYDDEIKGADEIRDDEGQDAEDGDDDSL